MNRFLPMTVAALLFLAFLGFEQGAWFDAGEVAGASHGSVAAHLFESVFAPASAPDEVLVTPTEVIAAR